MKSAWKVAAALLLISGLGLAQDSAAQSAANSAPANGASDKTVPAQATAVSASQGGAEYVIGPEDVLHIAVWKENDLTATLPVRPDGKISLPLLNDVQASGLTPQQLADSVTEKLRKY
ncbi:MAG: polysaccharide biosynthesis/export family protein, partial [Terriglobales bacterium]